MKQKILTIGDATMDMVLHIEHMPSPGEAVKSRGSYGFLPGGRGTRAAAAMARLSANAAFCTRLGADSHGKHLLTLLEEFGVNTQYIGIDKMQNTGFSAIIGEEGREPRAVLFPAANRNISRGDIEDAFSFEPELLFLQSEIPFSLVTYAAEEASEMQVPILFEMTNPEAASDIDRLPPLELFVANEDTTELLTGIRPGSVDHSLRAGIELSRRIQAHYYVMKLGARGAFVYDGKFCHLIPAYPTRKIVDMAGVGEAFTAALAVAYLRNTADITGAVRYACAAAALSLSKAGTLLSYPTDEEVRAFMSSNPN